MMFNKKKIFSLCMKACLSLVIMVLMATAPLLAADMIRINGKEKHVSKMSQLGNQALIDLGRLAEDQRLKKRLTGSIRDDIKKQYKTNDYTINYVINNTSQVKDRAKKVKSSKKKKKAAKYAAGSTIIAGAAGLAVVLTKDDDDTTVGGSGSFPGGGDGGGDIVASPLPGEVDSGSDRPPASGSGRPPAGP